MYSEDASVNSATQDNDVSGETDQTAKNTQYDDDRCFLPKVMNMPESPDGSYTPPSPHRTLLRAVGFASNEEYQNYCKKYDTELDAYTDEWKYNENGECGNWQEKYIKLHQKDMEILGKYQNGEFPSDIDVAERPKYISYLCKEVPKDSNRGCGGLADRMGGK